MTHSHLSRKVEQKLYDAIVVSAPGVVLVEGKRRVGKTTSVRAALADQDYLYFCVEPANSFVTQLNYQSKLSFDTIWEFKDTFLALLKEGKFLVFDEIQYADIQHKSFFIPSSQSSPVTLANGRRAVRLCCWGLCHVFLQRN